MSRGTVYNRFEAMVRLDICSYAKESSKTKPVDAVTLKQDWLWLLDFVKK